MCYDLYLIHPRCGHIKSPLGQTVYCEIYAKTGRICHSKYGAVFGCLKSFDYIISNRADKNFIHRLENPIDTRLAYFDRRYPSYCRSCNKNETDPLTKEDRQNLLGFLSTFADEQKWLDGERKFLEEQEKEFARAAQPKQSSTGLKGGKEEQSRSGLINWRGDQGREGQGGEIEGVGQELWVGGQLDGTVDQPEGYSGSSESLRDD